MTSATTTSTSDADRIRDIERGLFFIVGCGRSGTTLLQSMLLSDPSIILPPETKYFAALEARGWKQRFDLATDSDFETAVRLVWEDQARRGLDCDRATFERFASAAERTWDGLFLAYLAAYAEPSGATRVGEKSPVHTHHVGELSAFYPEAKFIHIVRDPRAVVLSRIKAGFGSNLVEPNVHRWARAAEMHRDHAERLGNRYLLVSYEDLVTDQRATLQSVCDFLGIELTDAMLEHHKRGKKGFPERSSDWMENTTKPVFTSSIEKWKQELKPAHAAMIDAALGEHVARMGYEPSGSTVPMVGLRLTLSRLAGKIESLAGKAKRAAMFVLRGFKRTPIQEHPEAD